MRRRLPDLLALALLFSLPLLLFWPQTLGGRTLIPTENLYQFEPYASSRDAAGAPALPHNPLVSDLVLQNYQWKSFIRESLAQGEIPLWNPHQFAGIPFLAAGQQSTLYPFSLLYYILPLPAAYGWFTVTQLWLAGACMYALLRGLSVGRFGAALGGVVYQLSGTFVISAVFPMIIAAAAWMPLVLLMAEFTIRQQPFLLGRPASIPWVIGGALALGCNILAGHVEITYYTLIITAFYSAWRLIGMLLERGTAVWTERMRRVAGRGAWLAALVALGLALGAAQFIPLFEVASINYRDGRSSLEQIRGWAHPPRDVAQFVLPNFYGNPTHHSYFDIFTLQTVPVTVNALGQPITAIDWGIKNYVEGALYLGILPLLLAAYALVDAWTIYRQQRKNSPQRHRDAQSDGKDEVHLRPGYSASPAAHQPFFFAVLTAVALTFMFGLPTYAILYYGFPGINQLHSPFRWILAVTLGVAALAGIGADALERGRARRAARRLGWGALAAGLLVLVGLPLSRLFYDQLEPLLQRLIESMALAQNAFADARMFYSYQFPQVLVLGAALAGSGVVFLNLTPSGGQGAAVPLQRRVTVWRAAALALVAADLMIASWGFNPASDPALLDYTPPAIAWLREQPGDWRYISIDEPNLGERGKILNANMTWRYGLDDVRGYESIIPRQYVEFMKLLAPQAQLDFNRVAPLYPDYHYEAMGRAERLADILRSPLLALLNVRYAVSSTQFALPDSLTTLWSLAYEDQAVRIWELRETLPRVYGVSDAEIDALSIPTERIGAFTITHDSGREKLIDAEVTQPGWLVVSETYLPGWRAFIRPQGAGEDAEQAVEAQLVRGNFQGVRLSEAGAWTIRLSYSPTSFQLGAFSSFIGVVLLLFAGGVYLWRLFVAQPGGEDGVQVVARNSIAPIILNLFNRGIDFAFAFVMLRILGPEGSGVYYYAAFIFGWFDIFTNFGLNVFLTREVARDRAQAWRLLLNTSALRLLLMLIGAGLLAAFLAARQAWVAPPLAAEALLAIVLLYVGLLPNSLSTGLSALFYAFEKAEYPAAVTTIATISKAVFGVAALALGYGVVGLAAVSILTNLVTLAVLGWSARGLLTITRARPEGRLMRGMVGAGLPLMINHFLATIFFQVDVVLIEAIHGARMVGQYSVAYKWVAALNVIPAFFTMALLPGMARLAREDRPALLRTYRLAVKLLVSLALPTAVAFTVLAYPLTGLLGGAEFLPDGAIATQLMIWSIPIGWINSLTQYALIALDLQRRITRAFILAVTFNIITNLIFIPQYGYRAAALTTIASELMLLIPFALLLRGALGPLNWSALLWKPLAALGAMLAALLVGQGLPPLLALLAACAVYALVLLALRPLDAAESERLSPLLPVRLRRWAQS